MRGIELRLHGSWINAENEKKYPMQKSFLDVRDGIRFIGGDEFI
jgi:hypothetical protein